MSLQQTLSISCAVIEDPSVTADIEDHLEREKMNTLVEDLTKGWWNQVLGRTNLSVSFGHIVHRERGVEPE